MTRVHSDAPNKKAGAIAEWQVMLKDRTSLLAHPGPHHRTLVKQAHKLHQTQTISDDDLSDLLELADGALAYVVEMMLDFESDD